MADTTNYISYKFLFTMVEYFNCGDSLFTYFPTILYLSGVVLSSYMVSRLYARQMAIWGMDLITWLLILQWTVIIWAEFIVLVKYGAYLIMHQDQADTDAVRRRRENITVFTCATVSLLPCGLAFCLYVKHRSHQAIIDEFVEFVSNLDPRRTEFGYSDRIKEIRLCVHKSSPKHEQIYRFRSCPNIHFKLTS